MTALLSGHQHFPWAYVIRADFTADDGNIYNEVLEFKTAPVSTSPSGTVLEWALPTQAQVDAAVAALDARITRMIADAVAEMQPKLLGYQITNADGTVTEV